MRFSRTIVLLLAIFALTFGEQAKAKPLPVFTTENFDAVREADQDDEQQRPNDDSDEIPDKARPISFSDCYSGSLRIDLNKYNKTPKDDLIEALKLFSDYEWLSFRPIDSKASEISFIMSTIDDCYDNKCANAAGWHDIQRRLLRYRGVGLTCWAEDGQQDEPEQDDGGSTGGSGGEGRYGPANP